MVAEVKRQKKGENHYKGAGNKYRRKKSKRGGGTLKIEKNYLRAW